MKKILGVFAHPDDESFGPGGTIIKWAQEGAEVRLLCATKGEAGANHTKLRTAVVREKELHTAAKILGVSSVTFLGLKDGEIGNNDLAHLEKIIIRAVKRFRPDILLTFDLNGISGHLDHIAVASATTQAFKKIKIAKELYYFTIPKGFMAKNAEYFVHRPEGRTKQEINKTVDVTRHWKQKLAAMRAHKSQAGDMKNILTHWAGRPKQEYFIVRRKPL